MFESEISALIIIYDKQKNNNPILFVSGLLTIDQSQYWEIMLVFIDDQACYL